MENTDIDYPIVQLHAFDKDTGANAELVYSIVEGNDKKMFTVNVNGLVLTRSSPDRESTSMYTLNVNTFILLSFFCRVVLSIKSVQNLKSS